MEIGRYIFNGIRRRAGYITLLVCMLLAAPVYAQPPVKKYTISNGGMQIMLSKKLPEATISEFIEQYDLTDLALQRFISNNFKDSVIKHGWKIELNNSDMIVLSKPFAAAEDVNDPATMIRMTGMGIYFENGSQAPMTKQVGYNSFRSKQSFNIKDSVVTFLLRKSPSAQQVRLAGNFTRWDTAALLMIKTDTGWSLQVKMHPGKYLYKFIIDGNWITDPDNSITENDSLGNTNSVYYFTNRLFRLDNNMDAKRVYVAGSFTNWEGDKLRMNKTATGWELPVYLDTGTYTYRFVVNNRWMTDPANPARFPNEFNDFNSVVSIGKPTLFVLTGLPDAKKVFLAGSFNGFREFELAMTKTATGWEMPYVLGAGNYEYKFFADDTWIDSKGNELKKNEPGDIFVIAPNYTFRLKGYRNSKSVFVSGDFNSWSPNAYKLDA
jgi:hypothetical protein